jgi:hypothetical protein
VRQSLTSRQKRDNLELRKNFFEAILLHTGEKISNDLKGHTAEHHFTHIRKTINALLINIVDDQLNVYDNDDYLKGQTMEKFLFGPLNLRQSTLRPFQIFVNIVFEKNGKIAPYKIEYSSSKRFLGVEIIDFVFEKQILKMYNDSAYYSFYLEKINDEQQWYGIFKEKSWDVYKRVNDQLLELITSVDDNPKNKFSAIIGSSGTGKTIALRRLANSLKNTFTVLWLTNFDEFFKNDFLKFGNKERYVLIIDDWENIKSKISRNFNLLKSISALKNFQIVVSDRNLIDKEYYTFLRKERTVICSIEENRETILRLIRKNPEWLPYYKNLPARTDLLKSPIYYVLFSVLKEYTQKADPNFYEYALQQLKSTVIEELKIVRQNYIGLAKGLYYWSWFCLINPKVKPLITWQAFLKLCNYFNDKPNISIKFKTFNKQNPIVEILSHYISIKERSLPVLKKWDWFCFHNELIAEIVREPLTHDWYFDDEIIFEVLDVLISEEEFLTSESLLLFISFSYPLKKEHIDKPGLYIKKIPISYPSLDDLVKVDTQVAKYYIHAGVIRNKEYWRNAQWFLMQAYGQKIITRTDVAEITSTLYKKGCKDVRFILLLFACAKGDDYLASYVTKAIDEMIKFETMYKKQ